LTSGLLDRAGVRHGFTTRTLGDVMPDLLGWEQESGLRRESLVRLKQVHGTDVLVVNRSIDRLPPVEERRFDAAVTNRADVILGIRTADCVPLLLYSPEPRAVAAAHAGWRGTLEGTVKNAVGALAQTYNCPVDSLRVALGPCIHPCCYRVGPDVYEPFLRRFGEEAAYIRQDDRFVDLVAANRHWLVRSGVLEEHIEVLDYCTHCRADLFFSHRREGSPGRQLAFVAL
jgi:YfiH family protein